jgi:Spx/MgsR family transcriptional regulator
VKGREVLSRHGVKFTTRDLFKEPLGADEIRRLAALIPEGVRGLLSLRSPQVKALGLDRRQVSDKELITLMTNEPRLLRRPLLHDGRRLLVGFNAEAYAGVGGSGSRSR